MKMATSEPPLKKMFENESCSCRPYPATAIKVFNKCDNVDTVFWDNFLIRRCQQKYKCMWLRFKWNSFERIICTKPRPQYPPFTNIHSQKCTFFSFLFYQITWSTTNILHFLFSFLASKWTVWWLKQNRKQQILAVETRFKCTCTCDTTFNLDQSEYISKINDVKSKILFVYILHVAFGQRLKLSSK